MSEDEWLQAVDDQEDNELDESARRLFGRKKEKTFYNIVGNRNPLEYSKYIQAASWRVAKAEPENIQQVTASALDLNSAYYESVLDQARQSFKWALIAAVVGFFFLLAAVSVIFIKDSIEFAVISLIAGALVEVIAGLNFYLYGQTTKQLGMYHTRLDSIQRFMIANSLCEQLQDDNKDSARVAVIEKLVDLITNEESTGTTADE